MEDGEVAEVKDDKEPGWEPAEEAPEPPMEGEVVSGDDEVPGEKVW